MKNLIASLICALTIPAFASELTTTGMTVASATPASTSSALTDLSLMYSSLVKGTSYAGVGLMKEWDSGIGLGVRGYMPLTFDKDTQIYMGQVLMRVLFLNETNQMYFEPTYTQGFYNRASSSVRLFGMFGLTYGFNHQFTKNLMMGASLGVDYSTARATEQTLATSSSTFYNKVSVVGGYYF